MTEVAYGIERVATRSLGDAGFDTARDVIEFIETVLQFPSGLPFVLFDWQKEWILEVFQEHEVQFLNVKTGETWWGKRRVVDHSLMSIARKNGKTGLMAAIVCAFLIGPLWVRGLEMACIATKKDQARLLFREVKKLMQASPEIVEDGTFKCHTNSIFSEEHDVMFVPLASTEAGNHGLNLSVVFMDELARMKNLDIYHTMDESISTQPNGMVFGFSTVDGRFDNPLTELVGNVRAREAAGIGSGDWHIIEYKAELDPDKEGGDPDPLSDRNMFAANPSALYIPELMEKLKKERDAARVSDSLLGRWITTRLNIAGASDAQFIDPLKWKECAAAPTPAEARRIYNDMTVDEPVVLGVDLSKSKDLTAVALWFPERKFLDCMCFWPSKEVALRQSRHNMPFRTWVEDEHLIACEGAVVDYDVVAAFIANIYRRFEVVKARGDDWRMDELRAALRRADAVSAIEKVRQGAISYDGCMIRLENLVEKRELRHSGSPILTYSILSVAAHEDEKSITGVRKPVKAYHNSLIDGCIAAMLAVGQSAKGERLTRDQIMLPFADEDDAVGAAEYDFDDGGDYNFDD